MSNKISTAAIKLKKLNEQQVNHEENAISGNSQNDHRQVFYNTSHTGASSTVLHFLPRDHTAARSSHNKIIIISYLFHQK